MQPVLLAFSVFIASNNLVWSEKVIKERQLKTSLDNCHDYNYLIKLVK